MPAFSPGFDDIGVPGVHDEAHNSTDSGAGAPGANEKRCSLARVVDSVPFRAVSGNGIYGLCAVRSVGQDHFDHEITSTGASASAGFAILPGWAGRKSSRTTQTGFVP
jgi:hypothetical protein